jgi:hypothetical protein
VEWPDAVRDAEGSDGVPEADPATLDGLVLAFRLASDGHSDRGIAEALNQRGYRMTTNRRVNPCSKDTCVGWWVHPCEHGR